MDDNRKHDQDYDEKRERRRQRRMRSQIMAYILMALLLVVVIIAGYCGVSFIGKMIADKKEADEKAIAEAAAEVSAEITVETPEDDYGDTEVQSEDEMLEEIVNTCISEMPIEDKIAGLFIVAPEQLTGVETVVKAGTATQDALSQNAVGGMIYTSKNIKSEEQITEMLSSTASMSKYPIFTIVCEDGSSNGKVTDALELQTNSPAAIGETGDTNNATSSATDIANRLNTYGFNLNIAPFANCGDSESSFGTDAATVSGYVSAFVQGLESSGVNSCLNSFPAYADTSEAMQTTEISLDDFRAGDMQVFQAGISAGAEAVMLSNVSAPNITGDNTPCSLSASIITDILRNEIGFNGIIITGELDEKSITEYYTSDQAAVMAIAAGADMIYMPEDYQAAYNGILEAVNNGTISEDRINESLHRIYRVKYQGRVTEIAEESESAAEETSTEEAQTEESATEEGESTEGTDESTEETSAE